MNNERIEPKKCLSCDRSFDFNEIFICKVPEWACFWSCCWDKYPDDNVYPENEWWLVLQFIPGMYLVKELIEVWENHI